MKKYLIGLAAILGLGIGSAVIAQVGPSDIGKVENGYIVEGNLVRSGGIIKTITKSVTNSHAHNAKECRKTCDADGNCNAYRYQRAANNRKPECLFRMTALPAGARRNHGYMAAVSATKVSFVENDLQMKITPGQGIQNGRSTGFDIPNADPMACIDACWRDGSCKGATYFPKSFFKGEGARCSVYTQLGPITYKQPIAGVITAVKASATSSRPVLKPRPKPVLKPRPRQVIKPRTQNPVIIQDKTPDQKDDNPGEMLDAEVR